MFKRRENKAFFLRSAAPFAPFPFLLLADLEFHPQTQGFFLVFLTASRKTLCQGVPYPFHQDWLVRFKADTTIDVKQQRVSRQSSPRGHRVCPFESSMQVIFSGSPFSLHLLQQFTLTLSMANSLSTSNSNRVQLLCNQRLFLELLS